MYVDSNALSISDPSTSNAEADLSMVLSMVRERRATRADHLGFPMNLEFDFSPLAPLLTASWDTIGACDIPDRAALGTKSFEREVLDFFACLYGAKPAEVTGYTASGGTEANLWGCLLGRQRFPDAPLYYSSAAHFGITRTATALNMKPISIPTRRDGSMDLAALHQACNKRSALGAVVVATIGTTMLGAVDDVPGILQATESVNGVHIHADAALAGLIVPFTNPEIHWNFVDGADSIAVSGHKMIGLPMPCAIALARHDHPLATELIEYTGVFDNLVKCCRDGMAPVLLWYALRRLGRSGLSERAHRCMHLADYAVNRLEQVGAHPWRNHASTTVVFDRPRERIARDFHLAVEGPLAHLVVMPHVTRASIDHLCRELR